MNRYNIFKKSNKDNIFKILGQSNIKEKKKEKVSEFVRKDIKNKINSNDYYEFIYMNNQLPDINKKF